MPLELSALIAADLYVAAIVRNIYAIPISQTGFGNAGTTVCLHVLMPSGDEYVMQEVAAQELIFDDFFNAAPLALVAPMTASQARPHRHSSTWVAGYASAVHSHLVRDQAIWACGYAALVELHQRSIGDPELHALVSLAIGGTTGVSAAASLALCHRLGTNGFYYTEEVIELLERKACEFVVLMHAIQDFIASRPSAVVCENTVRACNVGEATVIRHHYLPSVRDYAGSATFKSQNVVVAPTKKPPGSFISHIRLNETLCFINERLKERRNLTRTVCTGPGCRCVVPLLDYGLTFGKHAYAVHQGFRLNCESNGAYSGRDGHGCLIMPKWGKLNVLRGLPYHELRDYPFAHPSSGLRLPVRRVVTLEDDVDWLDEDHLDMDERYHARLQNGLMLNLRFKTPLLGATRNVNNNSSSRSSSPSLARKGVPSRRVTAFEHIQDRIQQLQTEQLETNALLQERIEALAESLAQRSGDRVTDADDVHEDHPGLRPAPFIDLPEAEWLHAFLPAITSRSEGPAADYSNAATAELIHALMESERGKRSVSNCNDLLRYACSFTGLDIPVLLARTCAHLQKDPCFYGLPETAANLNAVALTCLLRARAETLRRAVRQASKSAQDNSAALTDAAHEHTTAPKTCAVALESDHGGHRYAFGFPPPPDKTFVPVKWRLRLDFSELSLLLTCILVVSCPYDELAYVYAWRALCCGVGGYAFGASHPVGTNIFLACLSELTAAPMIMRCMLYGRIFSVLALTLVLYADAANPHWCHLAAFSLWLAAAVWMTELAPSGYTSALRNYISIA